MTEGLLSDLARMVSVDVESAGPNPADYALLSIGACTLLTPRATFYAELQPDKLKMDAEAAQIHKLNLENLALNGLPPAEALEALETWLEKSIPDARGPLFLGFNAAFDWMFLNDYYLHYLGRNPFGHSAIDIKSFAMGWQHSAWEDTRMANLSSKPLRHNALEDALDQADIFLDVLHNAGILKT